MQSADVTDGEVAMYEDAEPISYRGVPKGVPMLTSSGREFGTLDHVLEIPEEDLFDGVVIKTKAGLRFVDRDQIADITTRFVKCDLDDEAVQSLPPPEGTPVYRMGGRRFRRPRWKRER